MVTKATLQMRQPNGAEFENPISVISEMDGSKRNIADEAME